MRKLISLAMTGIVATVLGAGITGCSEDSNAEKKTTISTPEGKTTVTEKLDVKKSGDNPPPAPAH